MFDLVLYVSLYLIAHPFYISYLLSFVCFLLATHGLPDFVSVKLANGRTNYYRETFCLW